MKGSISEGLRRLTPQIIIALCGNVVNDPDTLIGWRDILDSRTVISSTVYMYLHECGLFPAVCGATDLGYDLVATGDIESQQDQRKHLSCKDSTQVKCRSLR